MASDLIERLRNAIYRSDPVIPELTDEAADALAAQAAEIERLRTTSRWNIEASDDGDVLVCRGEHEKNQKCEYEQWVPKARADALAARVAELEGALEPFANAPSHGLWGGPMVQAVLVYEDGTDENTKRHKGRLSPDVFERASAALHPRSPAPAGEGGAS